MTEGVCPHCRQPLTNLIEGVRLPKFKAQLFRHIDRHPGVSVNELAAVMYDGAERRFPVGSIRSHVSQINELLDQTSVRILGKQYQGYHVERR